MIKFKIIVPMYNVEDWIEATIKSVKEQTYSNYECIIVDDMSTDSSVDIVKNLIKNDSKFTLIENKTKKFALQNIVEGINAICSDKEDVILTLDGDDWLANKNVLQTVSDYYDNNNIWLTYGNHFNFPDGEPYWPLFTYPDNVIKNNSFRNFRFLASHLRTFKYKLWKEIKNEDLLDENGKYYQTAWDLAIMFPMLEMCGNKFLFISENLYVYNNKNPLNDYKLYHQLQLTTEMVLRTKEKYKVKENL
jgi:glycosyltransferase involved in cell wall biosynthesis